MFYLMLIFIKLKLNNLTFHFSDLHLLTLNETSINLAQFAF